MKTIYFLFLLFAGISAVAQTVTFVDPYPSGYSGATVVEGGKTIYVSGVTAPDASGKAKGNLRLQTEQVYEQIGALLKKAGAEYHNIVKMNIYVVNYKPEDLPVIREVRARFLNKDHPPASTLAGVQALFHPDILIEVEVVAVIE